MTEIKAKDIQQMKKYSLKLDLTAINSGALASTLPYLQGLIPLDHHL